MKTDCIHYTACLRNQRLNNNPYMYCEACEEYYSKDILPSAWMMCVFPEQEEKS